MNFLMQVAVNNDGIIGNCRAVVERNRPSGRLTEIRVVFIFNLIADTESLLDLVSGHIRVFLTQSDDSQAPESSRHIRLRGSFRYRII